MDLENLLKELRLRKTKCEEAISLLEELQTTQQVPRRGRRHMGAEERQAVSARMRNYWASRRSGTPLPHASHASPDAS